MVCKPFVVRHMQTVVEGGYLQTPWVPELRGVQGMHFVVLNKGDRGLAKSMGFVMKDRAPMRSTTLLEHLCKMRDEAVDCYIMEYQATDDPHADASATESRKVPSRGREKAFDTAKVPEVLRITTPPFTCNDGSRVEARELNVISTPKRGVSVSVELVESTLEWLTKAIHVTWECKKRAREAPDMPRIEEPLRWRKRGNSYSIVCDYFDASERAWKSHQETIKSIVDADAFTAMMRATEAFALAFYTKHHGEDSTDAAPPM
jgi:hypothetical protein